MTHLDKIKLAVRESTKIKTIIGYTWLAVEKEIWLTTDRQSDIRVVVWGNML